jgi:hypothetical protein
MCSSCIIEFPFCPISCSSWIMGKLSNDLSGKDDVFNILLLEIIIGCFLLSMDSYTVFLFFSIAPNFLNYTNEILTIN